MATKLKIIDETTDIVPAPEPPPFTPAPTRNRHAGWTAERQRKFIDHLSLTGSVGEAAAVAGVTSHSAYMLRNKAGAGSFARAWDAALSLAATRLAAIAFDRALNLFQKSQSGGSGRIPVLTQSISTSTLPLAIASTPRQVSRSSSSCPRAAQASRR